MEYFSLLTDLKRILSYNNIVYIPMKFRLLILFCYSNLQDNMSIRYQYCEVWFTSELSDYLNHANYENGRSDI